MLIKRTERQARHGQLAAALADQSTGRLDRRSFLKRSGLVAGGLATLGALGRLFMQVEMEAFALPHEERAARRN